MCLRQLCPVADAVVGSGQVSRKEDLPERGLRDPLLLKTKIRPRSFHEALARVSRFNNHC